MDSHYIDFFLQPIVANLSAYIRDSSHVLDTLKSYTWEDHYLKASLDVYSLYTSIPHTVGLRALQYFLYKDLTINSRQAQFLIKGTDFCLHHNDFTFLDQFFLQLRGTAMGGKFGSMLCKHHNGVLGRVCHLEPQSLRPTHQVLRLIHWWCPHHLEWISGPILFLCIPLQHQWTWT